MNPPRFAAVVYPARRQAVGFLAAFADGLKTKGVRVAGIVQETVHEAGGAYLGVDSIDVASGARTPIKRVDAATRDARVCALDPQALAETAPILSRAIAERAEVIVIDRFGREEQQGRGLMDEIMTAIAEGIPLLISVPDSAFDIWTERTGGLGAVLAPEQKALKDWWAALR